MLGTRRAETGDGPVARSKDRGLGGFVRRHGLVSFYAMAYGLSWLAWLPFILSQHGLGVVQIPFPEVLGTATFAGMLPGAYLGPLGAAFVVTALSEGRPGIRRWVGRLFRWGVNWRWYALALLAAPVLLSIGTLAVSPGSADGLGLPPLQVLILYVPMLLIQMGTTGLAEEPGWRDFALVRHQRQQGPLVGTLILGVLWAVWHLPLFVTEWGEGLGGFTPMAVFQFVSFCVLFSVFVTWLFNRTRESLPVVMLAHCSVNNFASVMFFVVFTTVDPYGPILSWAGVAGFGAVALALIVATRGRLGYRPPARYDDHEIEPDGVVAAHPGVADRGGDLREARKV